MTGTWVLFTVDRAVIVARAEWSAKWSAKSSVSIVRGVSSTGRLFCQEVQCEGGIEYGS